KTKDEEGQPERDRVMHGRSLLSNTEYKNGTLAPKQELSGESEENNTSERGEGGVMLEYSRSNEHNRNMHEHIKELIETFTPNEQKNYNELLQEAKKNGEEGPEAELNHSLKALEGMRDRVMTTERLGKIKELLKIFGREQKRNMHEHIKELIET